MTKKSNTVELVPVFDKIRPCGNPHGSCSDNHAPLRGEQQVIHENVAEMQVVRNMNAEARITMGNKGKKTEEKRKNYWIIGLVLASSAILLYILIYLSFAGNGFIPTGEHLTKGDWLAFFGTYLSFVGATLVSAIALVQTHIYAKKQNSRDLAVRKKQIQPIFSVEIIDIDQQLPGTTEAVGLYSSSNFPKHRNVHIRIENVAELPIRNVIVFDRYYFQLLKPNEPKDIYVVYSDSPDAGTKVAVIARILETEYERTERGIPKWFNINFEDVDGNESFQTFTLENFEGVQYYSLKSTEEI